MNYAFLCMVTRGEPGNDDAAARAARVERITHIGSWEWTPATNTVWWSDELYRIYGLEPRSVEITLESFLSRVHPDDRENTLTHVRAALESGAPFAYPERIVRPDGSVRELETRGEVRRDATGAAVMLIGTCRDVTEAARANRLLAGGNQVFEAVALGAPLPDVLSRIVRTIEADCPGTLASVLLVDASGTCVRHGAAPSLPAAYVQAIDGAPVGPAAGSCGTAAFRRQPVFVTDIENDPLWANWKGLALPHGLRACWSTPFFARDGRVLGTFALYYREVREPSRRELDLIARAVHLASVAVESRQLEAQLRALSARVETIREDERTGIAREIHDELGQALTALKLDLAHLGRRASGKAKVGNPAVRAATQALAGSVDALLDTVRRIAAELRPGLLDDLGLQAAIEWQANDFTRRTGVPCTVHASLGELPLPRPLSTAAFRVFQEALANVIRHANAKRVQVRLARDQAALVLEVTDDGVGLPHGAFTNPLSLGLLGMRERASRVGGELDATPAQPHGTRVTLRLPLTGDDEAVP